MTTTKTLLVFDWFGEEPIGFYLVDDAPEWLERCHGKYGNGADEEIQELINRVSDAICENPEHWSMGDASDAIAGTWADKKIDMNLRAAVAIGDVRIVVTGWVP